MSLPALNNQIEEIHFCQHCANELFKLWRGWPIKDNIPIPPFMQNSTCPKCGGTENLISSNIAWLNVHGPYSTGIPDYWVLNVPSRKGFSKEFPSKWGLPYFKLGICPQCGENTVTSLFGPPIGWQQKQQCTKCNFVVSKDGK